MAPTSMPVIPSTVAMSRIPCAQLTADKVFLIVPAASCVGGSPPAPVCCGTVLCRNSATAHEPLPLGGDVLCSRGCLLRCLRLYLCGRVELPDAAFCLLPIDVVMCG